MYLQRSNAIFPQMLNGFGYSLPAAGHVLEVEALSDVIDCLESIFPEHVAQTRDAIAQVCALLRQSVNDALVFFI
jgi:hypothetical protein